MFPHRDTTYRRPRPRAFTLIELLVVVAIIALLISILLPSLGEARRLAKTVKCAANLRGICQTMNLYAADWNQAILGNAHTSGAFLLDATHIPPYSDSYCPTVCQCWDWSAPAAVVNGFSFDQQPYAADRKSRFQQLNTMGSFLCPENDIISINYSGSSFSVPASRMISYNTSSLLQYGYGSSGKVYLDVDPTFGISCQSYTPKLSAVGNLSSKIFIADGARWSEAGSTPNVQLNYLTSGSSPGGQYADYGPWSAYSRAYDTSGNGATITYSMRHGSRTPGAPLNAYKFNAGFFDGHAETLDGLRGSDPALSAPSGTTILPSEMTPAAISNYHVGAQGYVVP